MRAATLALPDTIDNKPNSLGTPFRAVNYRFRRREAYSVAGLFAVSQAAFEIIPGVRTCTRASAESGIFLLEALQVRCYDL